MRGGDVRTTTQFVIATNLCSLGTCITQKVFTTIQLKAVNLKLKQTHTKELLKTNSKYLEIIFEINNVKYVYSV